MAKYKPGDTVYFVESNLRIIEGVVKVFSAGFYTIIYGNSVIRLRESRLFASIEDAEDSSPALASQKKSSANPWDYDH